MRINQPVTGRNIELPQDANILSTTDTQSHITYVNPDFIKISGFTEQELIGQPHNLVRHPDMPPQAFEQLWAAVKSGRSWMGLVKNRCKNGDHYWVSAFVTPISKNGRVTEYQSVRTKPEAAHVQAAERLYGQLREGRNPLAGVRLSIRAKLAVLIAGLIAGGSLASAALLSLPLAGALLTAALTAGLSAIAIFALLAPLQGLADKARGIADNPLGQLLYTGRRDELGQIDFALRMAQAETGAVIGRIGDAASRLGGYAQQLLEQIDAGNRLTAEQQAETDQIATAVNQMVASIQEVAGNAQSAAEAAGKADNETLSGQALVGETSEAITALEAEVQRAAEVIHQLESHSSEISKVLEVIGGIAEQTNLLALNAAIEAARAGEQGRGFAVVADEVRNLASRTQQSTTEIQRMIGVLQDGSRSAVSVMQNSREQAQRSVSHAQQANQALIDIGQRVNDITEMNAQIATSVEQQGAVSENINRSINSIRDAADINVSTGTSNHESAAQVAQLTRALDELARQFWAKRR